MRAAAPATLAEVQRQVQLREHHQSLLLEAGKRLMGTGPPSPSYEGGSAGKGTRTAPATTRRHHGGGWKLWGNHRQSRGYQMVSISPGNDQR